MEIYSRVSFGEIFLAGLHGACEGDEVLGIQDHRAAAVQNVAAIPNSAAGSLLEY